jgi:antitoxin component YwqK of YwqJK toxin-antitoxin module
MKKDDELICISIGNDKYFYKATPLVTQKQSGESIITDGEIPDGEFKEYRATLESKIIYKDGQKSPEMAAAYIKQLNRALEKEAVKEALQAALPEGSLAPQISAGLTFKTSFSERIFYKNGIEAARQTLDAFGRVVETKGKPFTGSAKDFYPNGSLKQEAYFKKGIIEGSVKTYDLNGRVISIEPFKNGRREGTASVFNFSKGILTEQKLEYKKGMLNGKRRAFSLNGGLIGLEHFKNDKLDGIRETYYFNGKKESHSRYKEDKLEGARIFYYESGQTAYEETFANGMLNGPRTGYYPDGKVYLKEYYKDNLLEGERIIYGENGEVKLKQTYRKGGPKG